MMDNGLYSYRNVQINKNFLDEVWKFDPMTLESKDTLTISKYSIALAQYLVFFRSEFNKSKAMLVKKKRLLEASLIIATGNKDIQKKFKTKKEAVEYLLSTVPELTKLDEETTVLQEELNHLDGIDKATSEYIATFKRELTRREKELLTIRSERRN